MGFIPVNPIRLYINSVLDLFSLVVLGYNVTNLSYTLGNKGNNPIFFTNPRLFGIKIS